MPADPMGDLARLVVDLRERELYGDDAVVVTYLLRLPDATTVECAERAVVADGWSATVFADVAGFVLRFSRTGVVTLPRLRKDKAYVRRLSREQSASWEAFAVELPEGETYWEELADRFSSVSTTEAAPALAFIPSQRHSDVDAAADPTSQAAASAG